MKIRNAELCDLPYLLEMLENAKASLRALGIDQWQNGYPNENTLREDIQNKICRVVIDDENNILASAAVYVGDEPTYHEIYNGAWQTENKIYGIVHRIMAANHAKKRGAASFLMTPDPSGREAGTHIGLCRLQPLSLQLGGRSQ